MKKINNCHRLSGIIL